MHMTMTLRIIDERDLLDQPEIVVTCRRAKRWLLLSPCFGTPPFMTTEDEIEREVGASRRLRATQCQSTDLQCLAAVTPQNTFCTIFPELRSTGWIQGTGTFAEN